jgi:hypothetical protein
MAVGGGSWQHGGNVGKLSWSVAMVAVGGNGVVQDIGYASKMMVKM